MKNKKLSIKNYTSKMPVSRILEKIEKKLLEIGASTFLRYYDSDGIPHALIFKIRHMDKNIPIRMPINIHKVFLFLSQGKKEVRGKFSKIEKQAARTAWKSALDWIILEIDRIHLEQVELMEVFFPYIYDLKNNETYFEKFSKGEMSFLLEK